MFSDHEVRLVFTTAGLCSTPACWPLFEKETRGRGMAARRCSGMLQKGPEALLTARPRMHLSPQCLTCASKRDVTKKKIHTCNFPQEYVYPSHPLCCSSSFQLFLLFLHLLTSPPRPSIASSSFPPTPSRLLLVRVAPENLLKFSEIGMCLGSCPATRTRDWKRARFSSLLVVFSAQVWIDDSHPLTHIYLCYTISHPRASVLQRSAPMLVFSLLSLHAVASYKDYVCAIRGVPLISPSREHCVVCVSNELCTSVLCLCCV